MKAEYDQPVLSCTRVVSSAECDPPFAGGRVTLFAFPRKLFGVAVAMLLSLPASLRAGEDGRGGGSRSVEKCEWFGRGRSEMFAGGDGVSGGRWVSVCSSSCGAAR